MASGKFKLAGREIDAVVIGASAGGLDAVLRILSGLPAAYGLAVVVVLHQPSQGNSHLCEVFAARLAMRVREAADKEPAMPGTLYVAGAGYHLLVEQDHSFALSCEGPVR
jgi:two-component system chemotaxis response regulator CheB